MTIKVTWQNTNAAADAVNVYRSETAFARDSLPSPLAVLAGDAVEYLDEQQQDNKVYFYRIGIEQGGDEAIGELKSFLNLAYTGPGPQVPVAGYPGKVAYYGEISQFDFIANSDLSDAVGLKSAERNIIDPYAEKPWRKVCYQGKILFIPFQHIATGVSWEELYQLGLVYGDGTTGQSPEGMGPIAQGARVTINGSVFAVRLFDGYGGAYPQTVTGLQTIDRDCEFDNVVYRLFDNLPYREGKVASLEEFTSTSYVWCQNHVDDGSETPPNARVIRGFSSGGNYRKDELYTAAANATNFYWLPVLELLPNQ